MDFGSCFIVYTEVSIFPNKTNVKRQKGSKKLGRAEVGSHWEALRSIEIRLYDERALLQPSYSDDPVEAFIDDFKFYSGDPEGYENNPAPIAKQLLTKHLDQCIDILKTPSFIKLTPKGIQVLDLKDKEI